MNSIKHTLLCIVCICALTSCNNTDKTLPILGHREAVERSVDGNIQVDTVYQTIPAFRLLNQDSTEISNADFNGSVYVADFFFTSCPSICPTMSRNLLKVLEKYQGNQQVKILSHSIDPKYDTPTVLKKYAQKLGVTGDQWQFATGDRDQIYGLADKYMVFAAEDANAPGGYEHQGWFILIDPDRRIRGAYDGTNDEQVAQLMDDMDVLLKEYASAR